MVGAGTNRDFPRRQCGKAKTLDRKIGVSKLCYDAIKPDVKKNSFIPTVNGVEVTRTNPSSGDHSNPFILCGLRVFRPVNTPGVRNTTTSPGR